MPQAEDCPQAEDWLSLSLLVEMNLPGASPATIYRGLAAGTIIDRRMNGCREALVQSLPQKAQVEYWQRLAAARRPAGKKSKKRLNTKVPVKIQMSLCGQRLALKEPWQSLSWTEKKGPVGQKLAEQWAAVPREVAAIAPTEERPPSPWAMDRAFEDYERRKNQGDKAAQTALLGKLKPRLPSRNRKVPKKGRSYLYELVLKGGAQTVAQMFRAYKKEARRQGWPQVSLNTISKIYKELPPDIVFKARHGAQRYQNDMASFIARDRSNVKPGKRLVGDAL